MKGGTYDIDRSRTESQRGDSGRDNGRRDRLDLTAYPYPLPAERDRRLKIGVARKDRLASGLQIVGFWICYAAVIIIGMYGVAGWIYQP